MIEINGDLCHDLLTKTMPKKLAFDENCNYEAWRAQVREKLWELLGMDEIASNACPLALTIESEEKKEGYTQIRFVFESEKGSFVPCYLLIPDTGKAKYPVAVCLQGHTTGFHNSLGIVKNEGDERYHSHSDFGRQAVKNGFIALAIEQRAMGERRTSRHAQLICNHNAMAAILLGRTVIGERVWDISRAIDLLSNFPCADLDRIICFGNSGGGTATFYAACLEERIKIAAPSCSFCTYDSSILDIHHCPCNYIPSARKWFDMGEVSCLIAPRKFIAITGEIDEIFPVQGVKDAFAVVEKVYKKAGAPENCRLEITPNAHLFHVDIVWNAILEEMKKLGW